MGETVKDSSDRRRLVSYSKGNRHFPSYTTRVDGREEIETHRVNAIGRCTIGRCTIGRCTIQSEFGRVEMFCNKNPCTLFLKRWRHGCHVIRLCVEPPTSVTSGNKSYYKEFIRIRKTCGYTYSGSGQ